jgi:hypothetical protein
MNLIYVNVHIYKKTNNVLFKLYSYICKVHEVIFLALRKIQKCKIELFGAFDCKHFTALRVRNLLTYTDCLFCEMHIHICEIICIFIPFSCLFLFQRIYIFYYDTHIYCTLHYTKHILCAILYSSSNSMEMQCGLLATFQRFKKIFP